MSIQWLAIIYFVNFCVKGLERKSRKKDKKNRHFSIVYASNVEKYFFIRMKNSLNFLRGTQTWKSGFACQVTKKEIFDILRKGSQIYIEFSMREVIVFVREIFLFAYIS